MRRVVDLRSDTVTQPTKEMRKAMAEAEVGDDVYREDSSMNSLEELAADLTGMDSALFVPSGTMGNLLAIMTHCRPGEEIIIGRDSHVFVDEAGGAARFAGVTSHTLPNLEDGSLSLEAIEHAIRPDDIHCPPSKLLILENSHALSGGMPLSPFYISNAADLARKFDLKIHIDGARIFNAAVSLKTTVQDLVKEVDTVTFCLSKGLCAPVGSMLCGNTEFVESARRTRKAMGAGMRQVGILAAAGKIALERQIVFLDKDHQRARKLAEKMMSLPGIDVLTKDPKTNMVFFDLKHDTNLTIDELIAAMNGLGVRFMNEGGPDRGRLVTHFWITDEDIEYTINAFQEILH